MLVGFWFLPIGSAVGGRGFGVLSRWYISPTVYPSSAHPGAHLLRARVGIRQVLEKFHSLKYSIHGVSVRHLSLYELSRPISRLRIVWISPSSFYLQRQDVRRISTLCKNTDRVILHICIWPSWMSLKGFECFSVHMARPYHSLLIFSWHDESYLSLNIALFPIKVALMLPAISSQLYELPQSSCRCILTYIFQRHLSRRLGCLGRKIFDQ